MAFDLKSIKKNTAIAAPRIMVYGVEGIVKSLNSERPVDAVYADCKPIFDAETARLTIRSPASGGAQPGASPRVAPEGAAAAPPAGGCCVVA